MVTSYENDKKIIASVGWTGSPAHDRLRIMNSSIN